MKRYTVVLSFQAKEDISNIYKYIYKNLKSQINADTFLKRINSALDDLSFMADSYHLYPNEPWRSKGLRYFTVANYSIFYVVKDKKVTVIHNIETF